MVDAYCVVARGLLDVTGLAGSGERLHDALAEPG